MTCRDLVFHSCSFHCRFQVSCEAWAPKLAMATIRDASAGPHPTWTWRLGAARRWMTWHGSWWSRPCGIWLCVAASMARSPKIPWRLPVEFLLSPEANWCYFVKLPVVWFVLISWFAHSWSLFLLYAGPCTSKSMWLIVIVYLQVLYSGHCQAMADELLELSGQALARESEIHQSTPIGFLIGCSAQMDLSENSVPLNPMVNHYPYQMAISLGIYPIFRQTQMDSNGTMLGGLEMCQNSGIKIGGVTSIYKNFYSFFSCWRVSTWPIYRWFTY